MRRSILRLSHLTILLPKTNISTPKKLMSPAIPVQVASGFRQFCVNSSRILSDKGKEYFDSKEQENHDDDDDEDVKKKEARQKARASALTTRTYFDSKERNKETFEVMLDVFKENNPNRRGVVEFIYAAVKYMDDYNVSYDLQTYKKLIQLLPEKKYVPENRYQVEFYHYPKQQECITNLLDAMEAKGVCPDQDMIEILKRIFGRHGSPVKKVARQLYWFPKFKNASPWPVPFPPISDRFALAKLAIERIVSVDPQSVVSVYETKSIPEALDDTFIVSGQSPTQKRLIENHPVTQSLYVEGAFRIWVGRSSINYFILRADPKEYVIEPEDPDDVANLNNPFKFDQRREIIEKPSIHEQQDGAILAVCATGSSSRDALLSWIRLLEQNGNSALGEIPVIFSLKSPLGEVVPLDSDRPASPPRKEVNELTDT